ncbi:MAG: riboflavin biosynthesis protein RibF [Lachnospiraceae bacterium]|nr:riboflavin biosynthesis protein RibF [Candidatus Equihabitans merdae]
MEYITDLSQLNICRPTAVTLGKFDGIHRGHDSLIKEAVEGKERGLIPCAFVMDGSEHHLLTKEERLERLEKAGIELVIELPLSDEFKQQSAEAFVINVLWEKLKAAEIIVGENYAFGRGRRGNPALLREMGEEMGIRTMAMPLVVYQDKKISSSVIKEALEKGDMAFVNACLGYDFFVRGTVVHGNHLGRTMNVPTTNIVPAEEKILPPNGVYASRVLMGDKVYYGMTNIGFKPTVNGSCKGVETNLFDCDGDFYGQEQQVELLCHTRPEQRFENIQALQERLDKDRIEVKEWLTAHI